MTARTSLILCKGIYTLKNLNHEPNPKPNHIIGELPLPRSSHVTCQFNNLVFLHGGCNLTEELNDAYLFSIPTKTWEKIELSECINLVGHSTLYFEEPD